MRTIDADALYKNLNDIRKEEVLLHGRMNNKYCCTLSTALYEIENAPTIEPERKKGKWTKDCACEICGFKPWYERDIHTLSFCPNCGADMRGGTDAD